MENNSLSHYGVLGMKWGVRRFQTKNGTLTKAGKKRYEKEMEKLKEEKRILTNRTRTQNKFAKLEAMKQQIAEKKRQLDSNEPAEKAEKGSSAKKSTSGKKSIHEMSNEELQKAIDRIRLEQQYKALNPEKQSKLKKFVTDTLLPKIGNAGADLAADWVKQKGKEYLGLKETKTLADKAKDAENEWKLLNYTKLANDLKNPSGSDEKKASGSGKKKTSGSSETKTDTGNRSSGAGPISAPSVKRTSGSSETKTDTGNRSSGAGPIPAPSVKRTSKSDDGAKSVTGIVLGKGTSSSNKSTSNWRDSAVDIVATPVRETRSSSSTALGRTHVSGLLSAPSSTRSSSSTAIGQRYIAGLLPAPKDDDD